MNITTVIVNWNGQADTMACLESLQHLKGHDFSHHIVVVDNGSTDGSVAAIRRQYPEVELMPQDRNLGFAEGNNVALQELLSRSDAQDAVVLLNNDTVVEPKSYDYLVETWRSHPQAGAVMPVMNYFDSETVWYSGGRLIRPWGRVQHQSGPRSVDPYRIGVFSACCVLIPVHILRQVGLFDLRYYLYLEDTDLALRIVKAGFELWADPRAIIWHKVSQSSGGSVAPNPIYYQIRNNILLVRDHALYPMERVAGYGYVGLLSMKMGLNALIRPTSQRLAVLGSIGQAWRDTLSGRWGART